MSSYSPLATTIGIWIAVGLTIAIYSFLYKDNPFYKLAEHLYIGVSTGYLIVIAWTDSIEALLVEPLLHPSSSGSYIVIIPGFLGLLMFTRYFKKFAWFSRIPLAFLIGYGAGLAAPPTIQAYLIRHAGITIAPIFNPLQFSLNPMSSLFGILSIGFFSTLIYFVQTDRYTDWGFGRRLFVILGTVLSTVLFFIFAIYYPHRSLWAFIEAFYILLLLVGVITVLFYFFYSIEHKKSLKGVAKTGMIYLMVYFGTSFGYTVMARLSLAIGRMRFIVDDWLKKSTIQQWIIAIPVIIVITIILLWQEKASRTAQKSE
jgi:hypothetical protein